MILSSGQIKIFQTDLNHNKSWGIIDFKLNDLCETALFLQDEFENLNELNKSLLEGLERTKAENAKLESTIRESVKTINRLALENSNLKAEVEVYREKEKRDFREQLGKLKEKKCFIAEKADWVTENC